MRIGAVKVFKTGLIVITGVFILIFALISVSCANETTVKTEDHLQSAAGFADQGDWDSAVSEYDQAIADLTRAIELAPGRSGPYFERGIAYRLRGDLDKAVSDLSRAIGNRSITRFRGALYERGLTYKAQGNSAQARADFERIVQLENERPGEADKSWAEKAQLELVELGQ